MSDANDTADSAWVQVDFSPDPGFTFTFDGIHGTEELGRPFLYDLDLSSGTVIANIGSIVGASGTLSLSQSADPSKNRYFNGIVSRVVSSGLVGGAYRYRVELRPWIWLLTRTTDFTIFKNQSPFAIITETFRSAGFSDFRDARQAGSGDTALDYCVQYCETSFDFVMRLMEQYGLYYYFEHAEGKHTLVIADDPNSHDSLSDSIPFVFDQTEYRTVADHIWEWSTDHSLESGSFNFSDYNFTTPKVNMAARAVQIGDYSHGNLGVYEYPGLYNQTSDGEALTTVRMQAISMKRAVTTAASNARDLHPGWRFALSHHPVSAVNTNYLVIGAEFSMSIAEGSSTMDGETLDTYRVTIRAIPATVQFRLDRKTPRPMIRGPQTARVVGARGAEIDTDQYGRVRVKFPWDRTEAPGDTNSCWIRVAQASAGMGWGSIFIPRADQEVVVEFLEGNPDRPLITGVVYNANNTVPYTLPDNKTRSTIKTNSSPGGNGFNELRFEDKAGSEEVFFQAQKDYNKNVLNNETVTIAQDTTTTVQKGNRSITVSQGNNSLTVSTGNHSITVSQGNDSLTVSAGNHSITVSAGTSSITAAQSITFSVGANSVKIDTSGVTINGAKVSLQANGPMSLQAGGAMALTGSEIGLN